MEHMLRTDSSESMTSSIERLCSAPPETPVPGCVLRELKVELWAQRERARLAEVRRRFDSQKRWKPSRVLDLTSEESTHWPQSSNDIEDIEDDRASLCDVETTSTRAQQEKERLVMVRKRFESRRSQSASGNSTPVSTVEGSSRTFPGSTMTFSQMPPVPPDASPLTPEVCDDMVIQNFDTQDEILMEEILKNAC